MEWEYKPAPGDPAQHVDSFVYVLWKALFGISDVPMRCQNTENDRDSSTSSSGSSEEKHRYNSRQNSGSDSDESKSSERTNFKQFEHSTDNQGRWAGYGSDHFAYDSKHSMESANPRWAMGWMQNDDDNDDDNDDEESSRSRERDGRWVSGRYDSSSRSAEHRRKTSNEEEYGKGQWAWKSDAPRSGKLNLKQADLTEGAEAKVKSNNEKGIKVEAILKKSREWPDSSIDVLVKTTGNLQSKMVCLKAKYSGERPLCHLTTSRPSLKNANITLNASLSWGRACSEPEGFLDISLKARKSREQFNMQKYDKPYFYDQCKDDKKAGNPYSYACMEKLEFESRLNYLTATIKYSKVREIHHFMIIIIENNYKNVIFFYRSQGKCKNYTEQLQDFVIYNWYPHLSHNSFAKNPSDQLKFTANFHPTLPVVDLKVYRPQETLKFNKIFYGDVEPFVGPLSVDKSYGRRVLDYYTDGDVTPTCFVTDNYVQRFDNTTFYFDGRDSCQYMISGDCSPSDLFYVLIKNNTKESRDNSKTLTVQFLQNLIEINPKARQVTINGKQIEMKDETITFLKDESYGPTLLGYIVKADDLYKIILPFNRISIVFDGVDVVVRTSNLWRNKLCGICGEYNPGSDDGFTGPRKCEYSIGNDFAESYALRTDQCPKARVEGDKNCNADDTSFRHIPSQGSCVTQRPLIKRMGSGNKICGSLETFKACKSGCEAKETQQMTVPFKCVQVNDKAANDLLNNQDKWIQFAEQRTEDFTTVVEVPVKCAPRH
uniref:VWFD domain-containing protein n=1 Tax=Strigamia maritima TaxID=126957 RepID=T1IVN0_STRMM